MDRQSATDAVALYRYVPWKALLFGAMMAAIGCGILWVGVQSLDPAWTAEVQDGQLLVDLPWFLRGPFFLLMGLVVVTPGGWLIYAGLARTPVVRIDATGIAARTIVGRTQALDWPQIVTARRRTNRLILSPAGIDSYWLQVWDRKSVIVDAGMIDAGPGEIEALVARHRPDLVFIDGDGA